MKRLLQYIAVATTLLTGTAATAQEHENINNRYGPPTFTGGTVASPSETFAIYQQQTAALHRTYRGTTIPIATMYPNPATTYTRIVLTNGTTEPVTVSVITTNGVLVRSYEYSAGSGRFDIDISSIPEGLYAVQVQERGKEAQSVLLSKTSR